MNDFLSLRSKQWRLIVLPRQNINHLLIATAHLAICSPMTVLDCGRQFDASIIARAAHGRQEVIDQIKVQRAFICYEVVKLLEKTPTGKSPILILDFLSTFYDENVKIHTRKFLLESSIRHFQRLCQGAGLAVTIQPSDMQDELCQRLLSATPHVSIYETQAPETQQLSFF